MIAATGISFEAKPVAEDEFTVTYQGGKPQAKKYEVGSTVVVASAPGVDGWLLNRNDTDLGQLEGHVYMPGDTFVMPANNINFKKSTIDGQPITYSVIYDANGGTGSQTDQNEYEEDEEVTVLDEGTMSKEGFHFTGWNTEADGSGTSYDPDDTFDMPGEDVTLYAQWEEDGVEPITYSVIYDANGGTGSQTDENEYEEDEEVTVLDEGTMSKEGFHFTGWNTEADGSGTSYDPDDTFDMPGEDVTLYAQWIRDQDPDPRPEPDPKYTVTFKDHDGTVLDIDRVERGDDATPPDDPTREGYEFTGWDGNWTNVRKNEVVWAGYTEIKVVITEEPVPEAVPPVVPPVVEVPEEPLPQAPILPKTGTVGAGEMAGIGALLMAIGILLRSKKKA